MSRIPLVAIKAHPYAGKALKVGDPYEAVSRQDAAALKAMGFAKDAPVVESKSAIKTRDLKAEGSGNYEEPKPKDAKRRYKRRDMTAKGAEE